MSRMQGVLRGTWAFARSVGADVCGWVWEGVRDAVWMLGGVIAMVAIPVGIVVVFVLSIYGGAFIGEAVRTLLGLP